MAQPLTNGRTRIQTDQSVQLGTAVIPQRLTTSGSRAITRGLIPMPNAAPGSAEVPYLLQDSPKGMRQDLPLWLFVAFVPFMVGCAGLLSGTASRCKSPPEVSPKRSRVARITSSSPPRAEPHPTPGKPRRHSSSGHRAECERNLCRDAHHGRNLPQADSPHRSEKADGCPPSLLTSWRRGFPGI